MEIIYKRTPAQVDWGAMKEVLRRDNFDNGRSPAQLQVSFERSASICIAYANTAIIGTARALSDGVCNAYVVDVWTQSAWRRRGIARRMMELLLEDLPGQHVYLFTDEATAPFYQNLGFAPEEVGMGRVVGKWLVARPPEPTG
ncbi:MAG: GNAT family N-acetyltransferase [Candidatus Latescibacteria bacterium]|nr:GNAT family N-acetyltransferase [Candidatus Latescibacterota bacterium]